MDARLSDHECDRRIKFANVSGSDGDETMVEGRAAGSAKISRG